MTPGSALELPWADTPDWDTAGIAFAEMLLSWRLWSHRRVEVIQFEDETVARRSVSLDFTLPSTPPVMRSDSGSLAIVPIARLRKQTLTNFDLVDEAGRSLPMLSRAQQERLATSTLVAVARTVIGAEAAEIIRGTCCTLVTEPPAVALLALQHLERVERLAKSETFMQAARAFSEGFVVAVPLPADRGTRRVIKFSYDEPIGDPDLSLRNALVRGLAWRSKPLWFPVYAMGDTPSYHLEVQAPTGLQITRRELVVSDMPAQASRRLGPYRRAHFYHRPSVGCRGVASVNLRPQMSTIVRAAAALALFTFALLVAFWIALLFGGFDERPGAGPTLLLFLPGALSVLLVRSGEHALTTDMLWLLRAVTLISGALAVIGGICFAAISDDLALMVSVGVIGLFAAVPAAALVLAWRRCNLGTDPDRNKAREPYGF